MKLNTKSVRIITAGILLFIIQSLTYSEYVFKKDGSIIKGKIIQEDSLSVTVKTENNKSTIFLRKDLQRILYKKIYMEKVFVHMTSGKVLELHMVDEDWDTYTFRKKLNSPQELKVNREDVVLISRNNSTKQPLKNKKSADSDDSQETANIYIYLRGGVNYLYDNSDLKQYIQEQSSSLAESCNFAMAAVYYTDKAAEPDIAYNIGIGLRRYYQCIGFGLDMNGDWFKTENSVYSSDTGEKRTLSYTALALSASGTIYYRIDVTDSGFISLGAGLGYYYGRLIEDVKLNQYSVFQPKNHYIDISNFTTFGGHIIADYTYFLNRIGLTVGINARYVKFNKIKEERNTYMSSPPKIHSLDYINFTGIGVYLAAGSKF